MQQKCPLLQPNFLYQRYQWTSMTLGRSPVVFYLLLEEKRCLELEDYIIPHGKMNRQTQSLADVSLAEVCLSLSPFHVVTDYRLWDKRTCFVFVFHPPVSQFEQYTMKLVFIISSSCFIRRNCNDTSCYTCKKLVNCNSDIWKLLARSNTPGVRGVPANICSFVKRMGSDTALHAVARLLQR